MLCVNLNRLTVEIEVDAKIVFGWVTEEFNYILHHTSLIMDYKTLVKFQREIQGIFHTTSLLELLARF